MCPPPKKRRRFFGFDCRGPSWSLLVGDVLGTNLGCKTGLKKTHGPDFFRERDLVPDVTGHCPTYLVLVVPIFCDQLRGCWATFVSPPKNLAQPGPPEGWWAEIKL